MTWEEHALECWSVIQLATNKTLCFKELEQENEDLLQKLTRISSNTGTRGSIGNKRPPMARSARFVDEFMFTVLYF